MKAVTSRRTAWCVGVLAAALMATWAFAGSAGAVVYSWHVNMDGTQQSATHIAGDPDGTGSADITGDTVANKVCGTVYWSNIAAPVVAGHIHLGGPGQVEDPAFTVTLFGPNINGASSGVSGCSIVPGAVITQMNHFVQEFNVTVHNKQYPLGAIRGQLGVGNFLCELSKYTCLSPGPTP
jgi:hypothetical protein